MNESEFNELMDDTIIAIEEALDELDELDMDYETSGGILTITLENGSKIIINRQTPLKQLWLAAKDGGYHLDWNGDSWLTDKNQEPLETLLNRVMSQQSGQTISLSIEL
ncbi:iron donor protein CyaY [Kangiella sediminilitoris]|uniref:iron donor protein CyaY n=1 Tax=Kangiella sediminilitoris TaxID=1144748 RepID=UPI00083CE32A|nr:iron donor protein CyaY [Kangiella sediminilitoris]